MQRLSEENAAEYLRSTGRSSSADLLVQSLSGGVANVVLKVFDPHGGPRAGSDPRSAEDHANGLPDPRPFEGDCFVLKQPLEQFRTAAEWHVDISRAVVERDCMSLLAELLPAGSVPTVRWFDETNSVLAMSCAPPDALLWKKSLLAGQASTDAATHAGMLLAMLHSSTQADPTIEKRFGDPHLFVQQRIDPYFGPVAALHPDLAPTLAALGTLLTTSRHCLIHGDYSPKNIFLIPHGGALAQQFSADPHPPGTPPLSHLLLLDFEVAFYGHPAFDVATLLNHLLLKGFYHRRKWRPFMVLADTFWETYRTTADRDAVRLVSAVGGHVLGALLLARVDGKSPAEYLQGDDALLNSVRQAGRAILSESDRSLDRAIDTASGFFDEPL